MLGQESIHQANFIFGFDIPLSEASERFFLFPPPAVLPSPTAAPRSPGDLRPPLLPPAALPLSSFGPTLGHASLSLPDSPARSLFSLLAPPSFPHLFFHISDPFFLDTPPPHPLSVPLWSTRHRNAGEGKERAA